MKKILLLFALLISINSAFSEDIYLFETNLNMENFWDKNGRAEEKLLSVSSHIINANRLTKRVPVTLQKTPKIINAFSVPYTKEVKVSNGFLPYIDNDAELAFVISHEIAHSLDAHDGYFKWMAMNFNGKSYEYKADLIGIDLMVKAGYDPIAAICVSNKIFDEPQSDWGFWHKHPIGSKRLLKMYKYIYKKYPQYMNSQLTQNIYYKNFVYAANKDISVFQQKEKARELKKGNNL